MEPDKNSEINEEVLLDDDEFIISRTDLQGNITYASKSFCKLSGYEDGELLGKSHNLLRHSNMPKVAFKEMWDTIQSGGTWCGYVKNRTKQGRFYWVEAQVSPHIVNGKLVGYKSIRSKPDRRIIGEKSILYAELVAKERQFTYQEGKSDDLLSEDQRLQILELSSKMTVLPTTLIDKMIKLMDQVYTQMKRSD